jgi:N-methylhydantoinase B/oxoprolinase/acetone carboxylase alpha subunit
MIFGKDKGALPMRDGDDAMHVSMSNTSNLPIEGMEMEFPLRVDSNPESESGVTGSISGTTIRRFDISHPRCLPRKSYGDKNEASEAAERA